MSDPREFDDIHDLLMHTDAPKMHFDVDRAVRQGKRVRTRRRFALAGGAVAVIAAAAVSFGTMGAGLDGDTLPAGPSPSSSGRVSADLLDGRYAVEVVSGAAKEQPNVTLHSVTDGKRTQLAGIRATPQVVSVGRTESDADGVMLGVAPARATQFSVVAGGAQGEISVDTQPLAGTEFQAIAIAFENATEAAKYSDVIWLDDKGIVRDSGAGPVSSALIPGTRDRVYADSGLWRMGVFSDDGGVAGPLFKLPETVGVVQRGKRDEATNTWTWTATIALLEPPSTTPDLDLTWTPGTNAGAQVVIPSDGGLGGPVFVNVTATRVGPDAPKLTSVKFRGYLDDTPRTFVVP